MPSDRPLRVLIVDDSPSDAALMTAKLRNALFGQYDVETVASFPAAKSRLLNRTYDAVLMDLLMPGVEGLEGVREVIEAHPDLPVIVLTGVNDDALGLQAVRMGAQDYLVKQLYHHHGVIRRVVYAIERHKQRVALRVASDAGSR